MAGRTLRTLVLLTLVLMLALIPEEGRAAVPSGFSDTLVTNVSSPTAIAFTPDGRLLITQKAGSLRVWNGTLLATAALTIPGNAICTASEQGLLGVAVELGGQRGAGVPRERQAGVLPAVRVPRAGADDEHRRGDRERRGERPPSVAVRARPAVGHHRRRRRRRRFRRRCLP